MTHDEGESGPTSQDAGSGVGRPPRESPAELDGALDAGLPAAPHAELPGELVELRRSIDNIDAALVHLLAERFRCTQQVGVLKARRQLPPADPDREEQQVTRLRRLAVDAGLDPVFAEKFLAFVIAEVIHHHIATADELAASGGQ